MTHYVKFWRLNAIDDSERLLLKLNGTAINSGDLSRMMNQRFSAAARKSFVFTSFRQVVQTVFAHFETDPNKKRWFNKMLQHADSTGEKYYETAMAPSFHAMMGREVEETMLQRETRFLIAPSAVDSEKESQSEPESNFPPNIGQNNEIVKGSRGRPRKQEMGNSVLNKRGTAAIDSEKESQSEPESNVNKNGQVGRRGRGRPRKQVMGNLKSEPNPRGKSTMNSEKESMSEPKSNVQTRAKKGGEVGRRGRGRPRKQV